MAQCKEGKHKIEAGRLARRHLQQSRKEVMVAQTMEVVEDMVRNDNIKDMF